MAKSVKVSSPAKSSPSKGTKSAKPVSAPKVVEKISSKAQEEQDAKVLKSDELGTGGFLSGLGFVKKEEKKQTREEIQKEQEQEEAKESLILERPRHAPMSFDTVNPIKSNFVKGHKDPVSSAPRSPAPRHGSAPTPGHYSRPASG